MSRPFRDVKIDILEGYIRTSERFRVIRVFFGVPGSYRNPPGGYWAYMGHKGEEKGRPGQAAPPWVRIGLGEGGRRAAPLGCPFLLSTKAHDGPYGSRGVPVTSR